MGTTAEDDTDYSRFDRYFGGLGSVGKSRNLTLLIVNMHICDD